MKGERSESAEVVEGFGQISAIRLLVTNSVTQLFGSADKRVQDLKSQNLFVARINERLRGKRDHSFEYLDAQSSFASGSRVAAES